jgi:hypothetical protein
VRGTAAPLAARGAAAEGVVGSDGSGKMNRREKQYRWRVKKGEGKMTDHGRGVADGSFVRPDFCRHLVPFSSRDVAR